jgi:hypothetical protein
MATAGGALNSASMSTAIRTQMRRTIRHPLQDSR